MILLLIVVVVVDVIVLRLVFVVTRCSDALLLLVCLYIGIYMYMCICDMRKEIKVQVAMLCGVLVGDLLLSIQIPLQPNGPPTFRPASLPQ